MEIVLTRILPHFFIGMFVTNPIFLISLKIQKGKLKKQDYKDCFWQSLRFVLMFMVISKILNPTLDWIWDLFV